MSTLFSLLQQYAASRLFAGMGALAVVALVAILITSGVAARIFGRVEERFSGSR